MGKELEGSEPNSPVVMRSEESKAAQKLGHRAHPDERVRKASPNERQVGWLFQLPGQQPYFVPWGCCKDKEALSGLISDVKTRYGEKEAVDLDTMDGQYTEYTKWRKKAGAT